VENLEEWFSSAGIESELSGEVVGEQSCCSSTVARELVVRATDRLLPLQWVSPWPAEEPLPANQAAGHRKQISGSGHLLLSGRDRALTRQGTRPCMGLRRGAAGITGHHRLTESLGPRGQGRRAAGACYRHRKRPGACDHARAGMGRPGRQSRRGLSPCRRRTRTHGRAFSRSSPGTFALSCRRCVDSERRRSVVIHRLRPEQLGPLRAVLQKDHRRNRPSKEQDPRRRGGSTEFHGVQVEVGFTPGLADGVESRRPVGAKCGIDAALATRDRNPIFVRPIDEVPRWRRHDAGAKLDSRLPVAVTPWTRMTAPVSVASASASSRPPPVSGQRTTCPPSEPSPSVTRVEELQPTEV